MPGDFFSEKTINLKVSECTISCFSYIDKGQVRDSLVRTPPQRALHLATIEF